MIKIFVVAMVIFCILLYIFLNLGNFVDVTEQAKKSDIIASLGGPSGVRIAKALELYKQGYSESDKIIFTGNENINKYYSNTLSKKKYLLENGVKKKNIIHVDGSIITNTMEEIFFIKRYLQKYHMKSVIFVSHPQHSRRIKLLANTIADYSKDGIKIIIVSCDTSRWNKETYYKSKSTFIATISETVKIIYNLLKYSPIFFQYTELNEKMHNTWKQKIEKF